MTLGGRFLISILLLGASVAEAQDNTIVNLWENLPHASKEGSAPFLLHHGKKTEHSALLIHGYSDSPAFVRSIGDILYSQGWNVVGILLEGHGTDPSALRKTKLRQWRRNVNTGLKIAQLMGNQVSMGGFSIGGALSIYSVLRNKQPLQSVMLFAPAIAFENKLANLSCLMKYIRRYDEPTAVEDSDTRYQKTAIGGICQQRYLMRKINAVKRADQIKIPVFMAYSDADQTISPKEMTEFADALTSQKEIIRYPKELGIQHSDILLPEKNPKFSELQEKLIHFISK